MHYYDWKSAIAHEVAESILDIKLALINENPLPTSSWQSQSDSKHPEMQPIEFENVIIESTIPESRAEIATLLRPNLPWAEDHFQERVSGIPHNPPPSSSWWPYARVNNAEHKHGEIFSHTYPERIWPPKINWRGTAVSGIRYGYGNLNNVIELLTKDPFTRQAYLPIWFPEDTGAVASQRVPCTLGYHFRIRGNKLHVNYYMRSCDIMRHMVDDLYLAARLGQWVCDQLSFKLLNLELKMGILTTYITSLHLFVGDINIVKAQQRKWANTNGKGFTHAAS